MSVMFRAEDEPVVSRVDYWRHLAEETVVPLELRVGGSRDFRSQIRAGQIDAVQVTEMTRTARPGRSDRRAHPPVGRGRRAVPTSAASAPPTEMDRLTGVRIAGDQGTGALVARLARQLPEQLDSCSPADGARLGTAVVDLLTVALAARLGRLHPGPAQRVGVAQVLDP
ncbi:MAG TPA: hypothetical protein VJB61_23800 [Actinomycetota bacterium]